MTGDQERGPIERLLKVSETADILGTTARFPGG
jgi:hypothetical protein